MVLYGKKFAFKTSSYFLISTRQDKHSRDSDACIGKLRAQEPKKNCSKFILYDNGENASRKGVAFRDIRREHGTFIFRYDPCNDGNIRKMMVLFPSVQKINLEAIKEGIKKENEFSTNLSNKDS